MADDVERMEIKSKADSDQEKSNRYVTFSSNGTGGGSNLYRSLLPDDDFESHEMRRSASKFKLVVAVSLFTLVIGTLAFCIYVFVFPKHEANENNLSPTECYVQPSCTATTYYNPITGFTNDTGWATGSDSGECCQICLPGTKTVTCFGPTPTPECLNKTGNGDYDYLLLDQIWIPQLCNAWSMGHDPTLSHLSGSSCGPNYLSEGYLSIHGLWPNYHSGFPQCCGLAAGDISALEPTSVADWSIFPELMEKWVEPLNQINNISVDSYCADTCYLLNHEWEKHGTCYSNNDPQKYFTAGLTIFNKLASSNSKINDMKGLTVPRSNITSLFSNSTNILCDTKDDAQTLSLGVFLEVQTCWLETSIGNFTQVACAAAQAGSFTYPCPESVYIRG